MEKEPPSDNSLLAAIAQNDAKTMERLYNEYRRPFIVWAGQTYHSEEDDAIEIFQKAFTILYFNVRQGKLTTLTSSLKTYLFSIGKNLFREKFRDKHAGHISIDDPNTFTVLSEQVDNSILDAYQNAHQREVVRSLLEQIGDPCRKLLNLIFIQGVPAKEVVDMMGYSDDRVVRKRKSLCLKQLRENSHALKNNKE